MLSTVAEEKLKTKIASGVEAETQRCGSREVEERKLQEKKLEDKNSQQCESRDSEGTQAAGEDKAIENPEAKRRLDFEIQNLSRKRWHI